MWPGSPASGPLPPSGPAPEAQGAGSPAHADCIWSPGPTRLSLWAAVHGRLGRAGREASVSEHFVPFPVPAGPGLGAPPPLRHLVSCQYVRMYVRLCCCKYLSLVLGQLQK